MTVSTALIKTGLRRRHRALVRFSSLVTRLPSGGSSVSPCSRCNRQAVLKRSRSGWWFVVCPSGGRGET
ncbi:hypothetical protein CSUI_010566 [Cystoisospora suis]|uniref:Uncharacterized protein n=1 Tax=Cystoisospora suis TaxID=483139 RepID=A0A2C6KGV2_9APIC|nr:hypothetical protein CSUI_010566 [Cystoisospora suis]